MLNIFKFNSHLLHFLERSKLARLLIKTLEVNFERLEECLFLFFLLCHHSLDDLLGDGGSIKFLSEGWSRWSCLSDWSLFDSFLWLFGRGFWDLMKILFQILSIVEKLLGLFEQWILLFNWSLSFWFFWSFNWLFLFSSSLWLFLSWSLSFWLFLLWCYLRLFIFCWSCFRLLVLSQSNLYALLVNSDFIILNLFNRLLS